MLDNPFLVKDVVRLNASNFESTLVKWEWNSNKKIISSSGRYRFVKQYDKPGK